MMSQRLGSARRQRPGDLLRQRLRFVERERLRRRGDVRLAAVDHDRQPAVSESDGMAVRGSSNYDAAAAVVTRHAFVVLALLI